MHYPTYDKETNEKHEANKLTYTCEEHTDTTFVTLLVTFAYTGLEVLRNNGTWMGVAPRPGSLVVNIGELLSRLTKRRFKATYHRVRDIHRDRYSVPFFLEPRFDAKFEFPDDNSTITYGPWLIQRMRRRKYQYGHVPEYPIS